MRSSVSVLLASLALGSLAGCHDPAAPLDDDDGTAAVAKAHEAYARMYCESLFGCPGTMQPMESMRAMIGTIEECISLQARSGSGLGEVDAALARGTVLLDEDAVAACTADMLAVCPAGLAARLPGACGEVFVGTLANGEPCAIDEECAEGTCDFAEGASCGVCTEGTAALGATCRRNAECAPSEEGPVECAGGAQESPVCRLAKPFTIVPSGPSGPCGSPLTDDNTLVACTEGLYCDTTGICRPPLAVGAPCEPYVDACVPGAECRPVEGSSSLFCVAITYLDEVGAECDVDEWLGTRLCNGVANLGCDPDTLRCVTLGDGSLGSACASTAGCAEGLRCALVGESTQCIALFEDGYACSYGGECASGFCRRGDDAPSGTCETPIAADACVEQG